MDVDYIIVGQGIAGTLLSFKLLSLGKTVLVFDKEPIPGVASHVAGAVLNPMANKNWELSMQAAELLPAAINTYNQLSNLLGANVLKEMPMLVFHKDRYAFDHFELQKKKFPEYLSASVSHQYLASLFQYQQSPGVVHHVWKVENQVLLEKYRTYLQTVGCLRSEAFDYGKIVCTSNGTIRYENIVANRLIFCEGVSARQNPYFESKVPFTNNRGDALIIEIPDLPAHNIYHGSTRLIPWRNNLFWCGSNYVWNYNSLLPNAQWRDLVEAQLHQWLKIPFQVVDHLVAERPTTEGQQVFLLQHEKYKSIFLFNGLGTRGFSAGPYWADQMLKML